MNTQPNIMQSATILNFSAPLPQQIKDQLAKQFGDITENCVPLASDMNSVNWIRETEEIVQRAWVNCFDLTVIMNPPPSPILAYIVGAVLAKKIMAGWGFPTRFMWTKWDNTVIPPVLILGGIS